MKRGNQENEIFATGYALGHCEEWLNIFTENFQFSRTEFTARVATLLLAQAGGPAAQDLPLLRSNAAANGQTVEQVALANGTRGNLQTVQSSVNERRVAGRMRWWNSLTPRQKKRIMNKAARARAAKQKKKKGGRA